VFSASLSGGLEDTYNTGINYSNTEYFQSTNPSLNEVIDQKFRYDNTGFNYRAYVSWVEPIGRNNFIQATYSFSQRNQESLKNSYILGEDGAYSVLDTAYSQSYKNHFINQRASLSFKAQREKYNYTIGLNVDPSYTKSINFVGDIHLNELKRSVVNLSPMAQFNYIFNKQTNLRINYSGQTSQPSMTLLPRMQISPVSSSLYSQWPSGLPSARIWGSAWA
jgi:hypothetical protein